LTSSLEHFLKLRNHALTREVLVRFSAGADLSWFDATMLSVARRWYRLAHQHLRAARRVSNFPREWRATVSRCYYATYNVSKCVRYFVDGSVILEADDHKKVGDLPSDFPQRSKWSSFAVEMRRDRNLADYDPWHEIKKKLTYPPVDALLNTTEFIEVCRQYLKHRGFNL
jgi:hypothetical protein